MHLFIIYCLTSAQCTATATAATNINSVNIGRLDPSSFTSSVIHFISINISRELRRTYYIVVNFVVSRHFEDGKMRLTWRTDARRRARFFAGLTMASYIMHGKLFRSELMSSAAAKASEKLFSNRNLHANDASAGQKRDTKWRMLMDWRQHQRCGEERDRCERFSWASRKL